jgi:hypothetical protein
MSAHDCLRSRHVATTCCICGTRPTLTHMPTKLRGFFCGRHCPICQPWTRDQGVLPLGIQQQVGAESEMILHGQRAEHSGDERNGKVD